MELAWTHNRRSAVKLRLNLGHSPVSGDSGSCRKYKGPQPTRFIIPGSTPSLCCRRPQKRRCAFALQPNIAMLSGFLNLSAISDAVPVSRRCCKGAVPAKEGEEPLQNHAFRRMDSASFTQSGGDYGRIAFFMPVLQRNYAEFCRNAWIEANWSQKHNFGKIIEKKKNNYMLEQS